MTKQRVPVPVIFLLILVVFLKCSKAPRGTAFRSRDIVGSWTIDSVSGMSSINFDHTRTAYPHLEISANGSGTASVGCNVISSHYNISTDSAALNFTAIAITQIACTGYTASENAIMNSLANTRFYKIENNTLSLLGANNKVLLTGGKIMAID